MEEGCQMRHYDRRVTLVRLVLAACLCAVLAGAAGAARERASERRVKTLTFVYRSHAGVERKAYLVVPAWYGELNHPAIPLVISPHGRGVDGAYNLRFWGELPARGPFALVSSDGQGRRLPLYSWGYPGQVDDLARLPGFATKAFPWLTLDPRRLYAVGDSMGGQESLLLVARHELRLAGVAAFDPVTDMPVQYRNWFVTPRGAAPPGEGEDRVRRDAGASAARLRRSQSELLAERDRAQRR